MIFVKMSDQDVLNCLVLKYLKENNFSRAARVFEKQSNVQEANVETGDTTLVAMFNAYS